MHEPRLVEYLRRTSVSHVAAGDGHSVAVTRAGELLTWGLGADGQLGHGDLDDKELPQLVGSMHAKQVTLVAAGSLHTLVVAADGIYACGCGEGGALGHSEIRSMDPCLRRVEALEGKQIKALSAAYDHSVAVCDEIHVFGGADDPNLQTAFLTPKKLDLAVLERTVLIDLPDV